MDLKLKLMVNYPFSDSLLVHDFWILQHFGKGSTTASTRKAQTKNLRKVLPETGNVRTLRIAGPRRRKKRLCPNDLEKKVQRSLLVGSDSSSKTKSDRSRDSSEQPLSTLGYYISNSANKYVLICHNKEGFEKGHTQTLYEGFTGLDMKYSMVMRRAGSATLLGP